MELDVDVLISIFEKYSVSRNKSEIDEQDDAAAPASAPSSGGGTTSSVPKWSDLYSIKRGKANMLGKAGEKWQTGLTRGLANQIW
jgi:hypothetical protein